MPAHSNRYQLHRLTARRRFALDPGLHSALTDLHAYALALDAECRRVRDAEALPTHSSGATAPTPGLSARSRAELEEELAALRALIAAFSAEIGLPRA